jgi:hypothetical protein
MQFNVHCDKLHFRNRTYNTYATYDCVKLVFVVVDVKNCFVIIFIFRQAKNAPGKMFSYKKKKTKSEKFMVSVLNNERHIY